MSIIYVGCVGVVILAVLGILGAAEEIAHDMRRKRVLAISKTPPVA